MSAIDDPTDKVREHLRELERLAVKLPTDTEDQRVASRRIRNMIGDQLSELTWWRPVCDVCHAYLISNKPCDHGPRPA